MTIAFIHIGMMKTASTYLQNLWLKDEQYALSHRGASKAVQYIRQSTLNGQFDTSHPMELELDRQPTSGNNVIISSEGFSCGYLGSRQRAPLPEMMSNAAEMLSSLRTETDSIMICVRNPVSWLSSMHTQFINEGQFGDWARFYQFSEQFLRDAMNLEFLLSCYENYFSNVVLMPFEYLKHEPVRFWDRFESHLNVPRPTIDVEVVNESAKGSRLLLLSRLNQLSHTLREGLVASDAPLRNEIDVLVQNDEKHSRWANRRFCYHTNEQSLKQACELLNVSDGDSQFTRQVITPDFADFVENKFIAPIEARLSDPALLKHYRQSLRDTELRQ